MRYYVVADVHGFYSELKKALEDKGFFEDTQPKKLIICGDLMDRGHQALKMQSFVMELMEKDLLIFVKGNHEDLMAKMLCDIEEKSVDEFGLADFESGASYHVRNGTWGTALQLADMEPGYALARPKALVARVRQSDFCKKIIPSAINYYETEHYVFIHGWVPCKTDGANLSPKGIKNFFYNPDWRNASDIEWYYARWYNGMDFACKKHINVPGKTVVCGHFHTSYGHSVIDGKGSEYDSDADFSPFEAEGILAIDACCAVSGYINCVVIEDAEI